MFDEGDAELDLLGDLLANGKTSRLYRTLVYERRVALDVSAYQNSRELAGFFLLVATAAPGGATSSKVFFLIPTDPGLSAPEEAATGEPTVRTCRRAHPSSARSTHSSDSG